MRGALTVGGRRFEFGERAVVGRESGCEVVLDDLTVSRQHAVLERGEEGWTLRDLESGNGTFVDGFGVKTCAISGGQALRFGDVKAVFEGDVPSSESRSGEIRRKLLTTLAVKPVRRARPVAAAVASILGVTLLVAASLYERSCLARHGRGAPAPARGAR